MEEVQPPNKRHRVTSRDAFATRTPRGYDGSHFPVLVVDGEDERCPYCLCNPCIIAQPPNFLRGSAAAHVRNRAKRYKLYHKFWQLLSDVGLWYHPEYLARKEATSERDDPRELMPECVKEVSGKNNHK